MSEQRPTTPVGELTARLKAEARRLGFTLVGVCPAIAPTGATRLAEWLDRGYAGEMAYLATRKQAYEHPRYVMEATRSIVMLGLPYATTAPRPVCTGEGRVSRYAWGNADYHDVIHDKLKCLIGSLQQVEPEAKARGVVDTAPLLEREFAQLAGLGWVGKHTLLINKPEGSYFFLAALLTDCELSYDEPFGADHCGTCRACLDACPTQAFPQPYVLDASRCISYLTIELRTPVPHDLRSGMGEWLFGCDVCQEVCPWNQRAPVSEERAFQPADTNPIDLAELFYLDDATFRARFRATPLWRPRRRGIFRNAAIVLGNQKAADATAALVHGLNDAEALVRGACAWALGQIGGQEAIAALIQREIVEAEDVVRSEIELALRSSRRA
jgi:epoxyqueuosine reductase